MARSFDMPLDCEYPDAASVQTLVQTLLEVNQLSDLFQVDEVLLRICAHRQQQSYPGSVCEIHRAWLRTTCLTVIAQLSRQSENRQKFDAAVQALFDPHNSDAHRFCSVIVRLLGQYRLRGTYEEKDVIVEAYTRGIKYIEAGQLINEPLAWLRRTCLNVVREFRRTQDKIDQPKLDGEPLHPGDEVFSKLIFEEDIKAMQMALQQLTPDERKLLCLRVIEKRSWQEVAEALTLIEKTSISDNAARQRGYRVLSKLRQFYDATRLTVGMTDDSERQSSSETRDRLDDLTST